MAYGSLLRCHGPNETVLLHRFACRTTTHTDPSLLKLIRVTSRVEYEFEIKLLAIQPLFLAIFLIHYNSRIMVKLLTSYCCMSFWLEWHVAPTFRITFSFQLAEAIQQCL